MIFVFNIQSLKYFIAYIIEYRKNIVIFFKIIFTYTFFETVQLKFKVQNNIIFKAFIRLMLCKAFKFYLKAINLIK